MTSMQSLVRQRFARLALAALIMLLTACGWQLRGAGLSLPDSVRNVYVEGNTAIAGALRQSLSDSGTEVASSAASAELILQIVADRFDQRTATISASARISERRLTHEVEYIILDSNGEAIFPPGRLDIERVYEYNEDNVLATDDEVVMLRREMQQDLVRQLQMRLAQAANRTAGTDAPTP